MMISRLSHVGLATTLILGFGSAAADAQRLMGNRGGGFGGFGGGISISPRVTLDAPRIGSYGQGRTSERVRDKIGKVVVDKPGNKYPGGSANNGGKGGTHDGPTRRPPGQTGSPDKPNDQTGKLPRRPPVVVVVPPTRMPDVTRCPKGEVWKRGACRPDGKPPVIVDLPPRKKPPVVVVVPPPRKAPIVVDVPPRQSPTTPGGSAPPRTPPVAFVPIGPPPGGPPSFVPPALPPVPPGPPPSLQTLDMFVPDEVLITVSSTAPQTLEADIAQAFNVVLVDRTPLPLIDVRLVRLRIPDSRTVPAVVAAIGTDPRVSLAQPNFLYRRSGEPARLQAAAVTGMNPGASIQYALAAVNVAGAQRLAQGRGTRVAVIDSGIDRKHPDFAAALIEEFDAFGSETKIAEEPDRHGTGIAGIISARGTILGIAPDANLLSARVFRAKAGQTSSATTINVIKGMTWSAERGARVLNMSFAGPRDSLVERHVDAVVAKGVIPIAAAGNWGPGAQAAYPAAYDKVIAVTAIDANGRLYDKANRGAYVAVAAPGVDVIVPGEGRSHEFQSGTSYAAAHISGIIALMLEVNPELTPAAAREMLASASEDMGAPGRDEQYGFGKVDAERAVTLAANSRTR